MGSANADKRLAGLSPRVRGNLPPSGSSRYVASGLSPRVRGNLRPGQPIRTRDPVYPRVCGGTVPAVLLRADQMGLSPRVRGNLRIGRTVRRGPGSIPVCGGTTANQAAIYPRVCGGTERTPLIH